MRTIAKACLVLFVYISFSCHAHARRQDSAHPLWGPIIVGESIHHGQSRPLGQPSTGPPVIEPPVHIEKVTFPEQRYRLLQRFSEIFSCDPDVYPIARVNGERDHAIQGFSDIAGDRPGFEAMVKHLGLDKLAQFSDHQKILIYREYKKLIAIQMEA